MNEYLSTAVLLVALLDLMIMPAIILRRLSKIKRRLDNIVMSVALYEDGPPDDPNDGEEEPREPSNVVAIGRRSA